jgi:hypothetical protein
MAEKTITGTELCEKLRASVRQMKVDTAASWVRNYDTRVLSERDPRVINPSEAEMNAVVRDLRS